LPDSSTRQEHSFEISNDDVNGPLNFVETVLSAQTSEPEWLREGTSFTDIEVLDGIPAKYILSQEGGVDAFSVKVHVMSSRLREQIMGQLRDHLTAVLGLNDDLGVFYRAFSHDEPLSLTFSRLRGLRLMRGTNLYESLICSILSQNNSARLWNRTARLLMQYYGDKVEFPDGTTSFLFPSAGTLAKLKPRELQARTSMGYRAKPVVQVSRMIARQELRFEDLANRPYEDAMETLLELPGVGPKVADCFLLYGMGRFEAAPVDVWIHRIVTRLYFHHRRVSRPKTARFLRDRFGSWAGYAQLYLFDYARRTAGMRGKKPQAESAA